MRTTISIEDSLYQEACIYAGTPMLPPAELVREAIKTYVQVNAAKRLALLGGTAPKMQVAPRRKPTTSDQ